MARPRGQSTGRERLAEAAGRGFRVGGFGGVGVDALAKEAGLTSGAFYAHFGSKTDAFRIALVDGLDLLTRGVERFQRERGDGWLDAFVDFYLGERMAVDLSHACALPTLTTDAARADEGVRRAYGEAVDRLSQTVATGLPGGDAHARALALLSILSGGAAMARAVVDPTQRESIIAAARTAAKRI